MWHAEVKIITNTRENNLRDASQIIRFNLVMIICG